MPAYTPRAKHVYAPLTSAHRQTVFLNNLTADQYAIFQRLAVDAPKHIHQGAADDIRTSTRTQLIHGLWAEQTAKHSGEPVGGGLGDAFNWVGHKLHQGYDLATAPIKAAWNLGRNAFHFATHDNSISNHTKMVASGIKETYKRDPEDRKDNLGPYVRDKDFSDKWLDVWVSEGTGQCLVTVRGSVDAEDWLVDDAKIATGTGPRDLIGSKLKQIWDKYDDGYSMEISGHSLGASLVAAGLQSQNLDADVIDMFNPGVVPWSTDAVSELAKNPNAFFYVNAIDPVSSGINTGNPEHLIMNAPVSYTNPILNHTVDQWISQKSNQ